jgi:hypothetical protein
MLDGPLKEERENGFTENSGLREFVGSLPQMAITKVSPDIRKQVGLIEREISRVRWDLEGTPFNYIKFWPLGHNRRKTWPFRGRMQRLVVVSPFLSEGFLRKLSSEAESSVLISRPECLVRVSPDVLTTFIDCYQLTSQGTTPDAQNSEFLPGSEAPLEGLHAKLYIADDGWDGRLWTGSANATESAFNGNVEFMVELAGKKSDIGVSAFLDRVKGSASFSDLLEPYRPPETRECDLAMDRLERELDALRLPIAAAQWTIEVTRETEGQERYFLTAHTGTPLPNWGTHISVCCRPLSIERAFAQPLAPTTIANAKFRAIALESVTAFLVVQVHGSDGANIASIEFVVKTEIIGAPSNRRDRILQNMLHDQRALMRFLLILLADVSENHPGSTEVHSQAWKGNGKAGQSADALLEPLLQTLARNPARLEAIGSLLKELASSEEGAKLMPQGLHALFQAVWSAREDVGL